jgi:tungstate transport system substrate-binding protein
MMRVLILCLGLIASSAAAENLRIAVTTSFENSGLADVLLPAIAADTGIDVQMLVVGTGQALRLGEAGDVDAVLVHARAAEDAFVAAGYAPYRREIMYNDFVLIGPAADPAGIAQTTSAAAALRAIAASEAVFVSRGDESGTHMLELSLWAGAGLVPQGQWYRSTGSGMGAALNTAAGLDAYILADRASWLNFGNKAQLALLFAGDPALFNQYAFLPVAVSQRPDLVAQLEQWLVSSRARDLIDGYQIAGAQVFTFNAAPREGR